MLDSRTEPKLTEQRRTDFVTQCELFDALTGLTKEEREDRHDLRNSLATSIANLDTNMDLRLRAVELGLSTLQATTSARADPEIRLRALEADRDKVLGAMTLLRGFVGLSVILTAIVAAVEFFQIVHP
jgi:hypothetical protein